MDHWLKEMWPPGSTYCNPLDYFMWCKVEREVNKCSHITLDSLKAMTSDVMTDLERVVIIHACMKFRSWIEAVMDATGVFSKYIFMLYAYKLPLKFHQNVLTLTISFIGLNVSKGFVLIYRLHPAYVHYLWVVPNALLSVFLMTSIQTK
jgi:hypothetical protein